MLILFEMTYLGQENYFQIRWKHVSALLRLILDQELVRSTDINIDFIFYHLIPFRLVIKWLLKPYTEQKGCYLLYIPLMVLQHQPKNHLKLLSGSNEIQLFLITQSHCLRPSWSLTQGLKFSKTSGLARMIAKN